MIQSRQYLILFEYSNKSENQEAKTIASKAQHSKRPQFECMQIDIPGIATDSRAVRLYTLTDYTEFVREIIKHNGSAGYFGNVNGKIVFA